MSKHTLIQRSVAYSLVLYVNPRLSPSQKSLTDDGCSLDLPVAADVNPVGVVRIVGLVACVTDLSMSMCVWDARNRTCQKGAAQQTGLAHN